MTSFQHRNGIQIRYAAALNFILKMKNLLLIFCILISNHSFSQDTITVSGTKLDWRKERQQKKIIDRDNFITKYVDSINSYENKVNCKLPYFFTCENFDQKHGSKFWIGMHSSISLRKLIIERIKNYDVLWCAEKSEDPRIRIKDTSKIRCLYCKIPFDQFSTKELVSLRLDELMNENHLKKN